MNGLRHGKGILYNENGIIKYEGDFVNGKYKGFYQLTTEN